MIGVDIVPDKEASVNIVSYCLACLCYFSDESTLFLKGDFKLLGQMNTIAAHFVEPVRHVLYLVAVHSFFDAFDIEIIRLNDEPQPRGDPDPDYDHRPLTTEPDPRPG